VDKKEKQAGNNPEEELKNDGFHDVAHVYVDRCLLQIPSLMKH